MSQQAIKSLRLSAALSENKQQIAFAAPFELTCGAIQLGLNACCDDYEYREPAINKTANGIPVAHG